MQPIKLTFNATSDRLPVHTYQFLCDALQRMQGKMVQIIMEPVKRKRSHPQNAFYYGVVLPRIYEMFREAGNVVTREQVHLYLKLQVGKLTKPIHTPDGETKEVPLSSTELTTQQWEEWIEQIRAWASAFDVMIPLPNENLYQPIGKLS